MSGPAPPSASIELDPGLVEETVLQEVAGTRVEFRFRHGRDRLYAVEDPEERGREVRRLADMEVLERADLRAGAVVGGDADVGCREPGEREAARADLAPGLAVVERVAAAHLAVGVDVDGRKEVLGIWVETTEGAKQALRALIESIQVHYG